MVGCSCTQPEGKKKKRQNKKQNLSITDLECSATEPLMLGRESSPRSRASYPAEWGACVATQLLRYELLVSPGVFIAEDGVFMASQAPGNVDALSSLSKGK